jgi:AcrR family transcriptional regulator
MSTYHHGHLRAELLDRCATLVARGGPDAVSLRRLAAAAGVSHAAPAHHFGDRRGLFTALAAEGFSLLDGALRAATGDFVEQAVAYVEFALAHPGHYLVMFDRSLVSADDPELTAAVARSGQALTEGLASLGRDTDPATGRLAAFSLVHGFAMLWLNRAVDRRYREAEPADLVRGMARLMFPFGKLPS